MARQRKPPGFWLPGGDGYQIVHAYVRKKMSRADAIAALRAAGCTETMGKTDDESIGRYLLDWYAREVRKDLGLAASRDPTKEPKSPPAPPAPDRLTLGQGGRVVIPASYRDVLGLKENDEVTIWLEEGELHLLPSTQVLKRAQELFRRRVPEGRSLADELIAERRHEARNE